MIEEEHSVRRCISQKRNIFPPIFATSQKPYRALHSDGGSPWLWMVLVCEKLAFASPRLSATV